ncbi:PDDEXK nuclease domain-containing protein [Vibrio vulnificus]|uniref:PDDEXK nuclease domain-containing protein n=1 Tax=Vibrio vulnificus TaxID=672 RepID=UPI001FAFC0C4|nr:PDDEXK nuclease domain-containing protein [Vibrio vulnificus]MCJ0803595.1 PDDEXK nuclease domain-containing protein [Vibrio vulnificus]
MSNLNSLIPLSQEVAALISSAKQRAAAAINNEITLLYWQVGNRIRQEVLGGGRADYGKQVIATLATELTAQYGKGWSKRNLAQMVKFAEVFTDAHIVQTLSAQLSWSHFVILCAIDDPLKRDFYTSMAMQERWSTRTLDERIGALLFERTAISKKPDETIVAELTELRVSGQYNKNLLLKDPYILDFLELNDRYLEKDLEDAILRDIEQFLLELGAGFTFVARQKRIQIDNDDFYIDLLFYNRKLKRLVAIDLKLEKFKHSHKSQMELYLSWLKKYETEEGENPPLGIILCSSKKQEQIELLEMEGSDIHVAEYLTRLIDVELLEQKLQHSIANAKQRLNNQGG